MVYIDTHCHLNFAQYRQDLEEVISRAFEVGVFKMINVGTDLITSQDSVNLAGRYQDIFASVGIHPHDAKAVSQDVLIQLEDLAQDPGVVAIGEIGLDYFRHLSTPDTQKEAFISQLKLALKLGKPVIIHCRDAYRDVLDILDKTYLSAASPQPPGVIHSFSSGPQYLQEFLKRGFYVGFNGMITYPQNDRLAEAVRSTPLDRLLIETDAPFLAPEGYRGQRNEPSWVVEVAKAIAQLKGISLGEVARLTTDNAHRLFGLK